MRVIKEQQEKETESIKAKLEDFAIQDSMSNAQEKNRKVKSQITTLPPKPQPAAESGIVFLELTYIQKLAISP